MTLKSRRDGTVMVATLFTDPTSGQPRFRLDDGLVINSPIALMNNYRVIDATAEEIALLENQGVIWTTSDPDDRGP